MHVLTSEAREEEADAAGSVRLAIRLSLFANFVLAALQVRHERFPSSVLLELTVLVIAPSCMPLYPPYRCRFSQPVSMRVSAQLIMSGGCESHAEFRLSSSLRSVREYPSKRPAQASEESG